jgi:hypothetical protein
VITFSPGGGVGETTSVGVLVTCGCPKFLPTFGGILRLTATTMDAIVARAVIIKSFDFVFIAILGHVVDLLCRPEIGWMSEKQVKLWS